MLIIFLCPGVNILSNGASATTFKVWKVASSQFFSLASVKTSSSASCALHCIRWSTTEAYWLNVGNLAGRWLAASASNIPRITKTATLEDQLISMWYPAVVMFWRMFLSIFRYKVWPMLSLGWSWLMSMLTLPQDVGIHCGYRLPSLLNSSLHSNIVFLTPVRAISRAHSPLLLMSWVVHSSSFGTSTTWQ